MDDPLLHLTSSGSSNSVWHSKERLPTPWHYSEWSKILNLFSPRACGLVTFFLSPGEALGYQSQLLHRVRILLFQVNERQKQKTKHTKENSIIYNVFRKI